MYGLLLMHYHPNSKCSDFDHFGKLLFRRHFIQGWDTAVLKGIFDSALKVNKVKMSILENTPPPDWPGCYVYYFKTIHSMANTFSTSNTFQVISLDVIPGKSTLKYAERYLNKQWWAILLYIHKPPFTMC